MILPMILNGHHKEFVIKAFAQFMTGTRGNRNSIDKGFRFRRVHPTYNDKWDVVPKSLHTPFTRFFLFFINQNIQHEPLSLLNLGHLTECCKNMTKNK